MHNPRLELLRDYPFQRLRDLLDPIKPKTDRKPISMSLGEPQHPFPEFVGEILHANRHLYSVDPPANGTPDFRQAAADWLNAACPNSASNPMKTRMADFTSELEFYGIAGRG